MSDGADCRRPPIARAVVSLSLLRSQRGRLIFSIHVYFRDAGLWAGMVRRGLPCAFEQLHSTEFLQGNTTPVCRRAGRLQSPATLPTILITQHTNPAFVIPAQPVGTEPPIPAVIDGSNWTFALHRRPDQSIHVLDCLDPRLNNTHLLHDTRLSPGSSTGSTIYNTVITKTLLSKTRQDRRHVA